MVFLGRIKPFFWIFLVLVLLWQCGKDKKVSQDIAKIHMDLNISRFDSTFDAAGPEALPDLKNEYPYLFPAQYPDSVWIAKLKDTLQIELRSEVHKAFPNFEKEREGLEQLFKHAVYYFPNYKVPNIITLTNDVDHQNRIILADSILFISLDNYLGADHKFYRGFSNYISDGLDPEYLVSDVADGIVRIFVPGPNSRDFLAQMVYFGKGLYIKDLIMPFASDAQKMGYLQDQIDWAVANEEPIWRNFIENELLYSTDNKLGPRFLDPAPFSKFGLELDNESPGRIGRFIGWQIVRAFMDRNNVTPQQMLALPADEIFKKSNYKPNR